MKSATASAPVLYEGLVSLPSLVSFVHARLAAVVGAAPFDLEDALKSAERIESFEKVTGLPLCMNYDTPFHSFAMTRVKPSMKLIVYCRSLSSKTLQCCAVPYLQWDDCNLNSKVPGSPMRLPPVCLKNGLSSLIGYICAAMATLTIEMAPFKAMLDQELSAQERDRLKKCLVCRSMFYASNSCFGLDYLRPV